MECILITKENYESLKISKLFHFTNLKNLNSILKKGLLTRKYLENNSYTFSYNDEKRNDHCSDSISLSIGFPNHSVFFKFRQNNRSEKWVVIEIDPIILTEYDFVSCLNNAACNSESTIPLEEKKGFEHLCKLFQKNNNLLPGMPANHQSEILLLNNINRRYIKKVYFENKKEKLMYIKNSKNLNQNIKAKIKVKSLLFSQREYYIDHK